MDHRTTTRYTARIELDQSVVTAAQRAVVLRRLSRYHPQILPTATDHLGARISVGAYSLTHAAMLATALVMDAASHAGVDAPAVRVDVAVDLPTPPRREAVRVSLGDLP
jgi:hypothetical protein